MIFAQHSRMQSEVANH